MKAEIIAVGTELLLGQIVNTNAQFLAEELAGVGVSVYFQTVVGDNRERIRQALEIARSRADLIVCTGGLGPTQDDLTRDAVAEFLGRKLCIHEPSLRKIEQYFQSRGIPMVESNTRQALIVEGAIPLTNETGMAVGSAVTDGTTQYVLLPGPPRELKPMFKNYALPWILGRMPTSLPLYSKMLKFAGIGESSLEHALLDLIGRQSDPTIAPYAKEGEVCIRLTTRAADAAQGEARLAATEAEIRARVGNHLYATEDITLEEAIVRQMENRGLTLSAAESCTGGMLGDLLTSVPGSSAVYRGGIICYTNAVKEQILGVPGRLLEGAGAPGAVSAETAAAMAERMRELAGTDFAVAITGVAGPSSVEGKPVGLVYIAVAGRSRDARVYENQFAGNRFGVKIRAVKHALYRLWDELKTV